MSSKIYLFPDTNLFIQCKPLNELNWSEWEEYDEVCLIVSRPVQAEIDRQKGGGNTRLSKRARATSSIFREILLSKEKYFEVRISKPTVRLYLRQEIKPDESISGQLIYSERDDQLVGVTSSFAKSHSNERVLLLTHDTGPMTSADMVGVNFFPIPDEWFLTAESSENDKQLANLQAELARLKKKEPSIKIQLDDKTIDGEILTQLKRDLYLALTDDQISSLLNVIATSIPIEDKFNDESEEIIDNSNLLSHFNSAVGITKEFIPASDEEIDKYKKQSYPSWLQECKEYLHNCHNYFNNTYTTPIVKAYLSNMGTRPAEDTLATFSVKGAFLIAPPPYKDDEDSDGIVPKPSLPLPPPAPKGRWKTKRLFSSLAGYKSSFNNSDLLSKKLSVLSSPLLNNPRDPNSFYYKDRPIYPVETFSLTCQQLRHKSDEEIFETYLYFKLSTGSKSGVLEMKVQAANMADPVSIKKPIKALVNEVSSFEKAKNLVEDLIESIKPLKL